jgi:hypothetical protein
VGTNLYIPQPQGSNTAWSTGTNYLRLVPVYISKTVTANQISTEITTVGTTGAVARLGIYNSDANFQPSTLLLDAGTVSTTTLGQANITISQALTAGVYWLAVVGQVASSVLRGYQYGWNGLIQTTTWQTATSLNAYEMSGVSAGLPTLSGLSAVSVAPVVRLRVS